MMPSIQKRKKISFWFFILAISFAVLVFVWGFVFDLYIAPAVNWKSQDGAMAAGTGIAIIIGLLGVIWSLVSILLGCTTLKQTRISLWWVIPQLGGLLSILFVVLNL